MNRELPILFNTKMVRAILEGRKTVTRRIVKFPINKFTGEVPDWNNVRVHKNTIYSSEIYFSETPFYGFKIKSKYYLGDILYVRETWNHYNYDNLSTGEHREGYFYKASPELKSTLPDYVQLHWGEKWKPSIHMPKEAARIWLRVTDVRVERLQDIMKDEPGPENQIVKEGCKYGCNFIAVWESTVKKSECHLYGWDANPWVFVYEFERIEHE